MNNIARIALQTLCIKETTRLFRIWPQTILPPVITTSLYFLIFGRFIGEKIGPMGGVPYLLFIVPGLVMMTIIVNSYFNTVSSFFSIKFVRSIEELVVSPTPPYIILLGFTSGGVMRGLVVGSIVILTARFFSPYHIAHPFLLLLVGLFSAFFFSIAGIINSYYAKRFDDVTIVPSFILTPLTYLGGIFYPISDLHGFWRVIAMLNPIAYIIDAARFAFLGHGNFPPIYAISILSIMSAIIFVVALKLLRDGAHYVAQ